MKTSSTSCLVRVCLLWVVATFGSMACDERNPLYLGVAPAPDAAGGGQNGGDDGGANFDAFFDDEADAAPLQPDGGVCSPAICEANFGAPACGAWICKAAACAVNCPNCTDKDGDGFGDGAGCAGRDCDDGDPRVRDEVQSRMCYQGPMGTRGRGSCRAGVASCTRGVWSQCQGQSTPLAEACNGEDDDCNGQTDDLPPVTCGIGVCASSVAACTESNVQECEAKAAPEDDDRCGGGDEDCDGAIDEDCETCVWVTGTGNDNLADGTTLRPFRSVQRAVDFAHANPMRPQRVCVAASVSCQTPGNTIFGRFDEGEGKSLIMRNGVSVVGGYEATTWKLCAAPADSVLPANAPTLVVRSPAGVVFPGDVKTPTVLAGFRIERAVSAANTVGVTIASAQGAVLSNVIVEPGAKAETNVGVDVFAQAQALITRSQIVSGPGERASFGVRVKDAAIELVDNCAMKDERGRCLASCRGGGGGIASGSGENQGASVAVALDGSAARVTGNAVCAGTGADSTGIDIRGDSRSVVIGGNVVHAQGGRNSAAGVRAEACANASPWIVGNVSLTAAADADDARVAGVMAVGACHPRIEGNQLVAATGSKGKSATAGVWCDGRGDATSACQILRNSEIRGVQMGSAEAVSGVRCGNGGCARIAGNTIIGGRAKRSVGLWLSEGSVRVERNVIAGGCSLDEAIGVFADDTGARIENNIVFGAACEAESTDRVVGVLVRAGNGRRAVDLHSNTVAMSRTSERCQGDGVRWEGPSADADVVAGNVRNNIFVRGGCTGPLFVEAGTRPRVLENNLFGNGQGPLYIARGNVPLALPDINRSGGGSNRRNNLAGDPMFVDFPRDLHVEDGSPAINHGTSTEAPRVDHEGKERDGEPDIGALER